MGCFVSKDSDLGRKAMEKVAASEQAAQESAKAAKETNAAKQATQFKPTKIGRKSMTATAGVKKATADKPKGARGAQIEGLRQMIQCLALQG